MIGETLTVKTLAGSLPVWQNEVGTQLDEVGNGEEVLVIRDGVADDDANAFSLVLTPRGIVGLMLTPHYTVERRI